jgi:hypothetical protein
MPKIVFFNHYHRGDLHTHKEFIKQIMDESIGLKFEYLHNNPSVLTDEFGVLKTGNPDHLDKSTLFYQDEETLFVNTWVASDWDLFCKHAGINMHLLYEQWGKIFSTVNSFFDTNILLKPTKEEYLPRIDYSKAYTKTIDEYVKEEKRRILICNNIPASNQSFGDNMSEYVEQYATKHPDTDFICTNKFKTDKTNIKFTSEIIRSAGECDLLEISYLSKFCSVIIGKNSGPYVFCETYDNYMDPNKTFVSFNKKHPEYDTIRETMSNGINYKCKYHAIPILSDPLSQQDHAAIKTILDEVI